jgi:hypothetical protein
MHKIKELDIENTLLLLKDVKYYNSVEEIQFAKGKYEIAKTWKGLFKKIKLFING